MAKRFKWRLESVKNVKTQEEERNQQRLVEAQNALRAEEASLAGLCDQREVYHRQLQEKQSGRLNTADMSVLHAYLEQLAGKIQAQSSRVESARSTVEQRREALLKSVQENKVLENLETRDYQAFRKAESRKDQAAMDETANRRASGRGR